MAIPSGFNAVYTHHGEWSASTPSGNKFRACCQVFAKDTGTAQELYLRRYVEVSTGADGGFGGTSLQLGWTNPEENAKSVRIYESGATAIYDVAWVTLAYGQSEPVKESDAFATYTGGSGTKYYSHAGFTYTASKTTYVVSYDANGGTGAPSSQNKTHGTTLTLSSTIPTRTGYTFKNWNTKQDGSGITYSAGASYMGNSTVTLYAQWTANTYRISYDANGGTGAPSSQAYSYAPTGYTTLSSTIPTRKGYNFVGWGTSSTDTTADWSAGGLYDRNYAGDRTLYAIWKERTGSVSVFVNGVWKNGNPYNSEQKQGCAYVFINGEWKQGVT
jgi:uncharacterized repeat protein (TIGR02543 family)